MNKYILSAVATSLLIVPFGVNTASLNAQINNLQVERSPAIQLAQNNFPGGKKMGRGFGMQKFLDQLDLTAEQSEKIAAIQDDSRNDNQSLYQEMKANHQEMRSLFNNDASPEQLRQQHQEIQSLRQQLGNNRFETMLQIREVLTPEQRDRLAELIEQHQEQRRDRWGGAESGN